MFAYRDYDKSFKAPKHINYYLFNLLMNSKQRVRRAPVRINFQLCQSLLIFSSQCKSFLCDPLLAIYIKYALTFILYALHSLKNLLESCIQHFSYTFNLQYIDFLWIVRNQYPIYVVLLKRKT